MDVFFAMDMYATYRWKFNHLLELVLHKKLTVSVLNYNLFDFYLKFNHSFYLKNMQNVIFLL